MQWPNLVGKLRVQPSQGTWHQWKQDIANHCNGQCVYCAIPESRFGGIRNYHIEHFRPKARFPRLENRIKNLYLACAICNVLKSDDWPCEPVADHSLASYPDPHRTDYNALFAISPITHEVSSPTIAGTYVVERVLLNRAQLILERRLAHLQEYIVEFNNWVSASIEDMTPDEWKALVKVFQEISKVHTGALRARPYIDLDVKRPSNSRSVKKRANHG